MFFDFFYLIINWRQVQHTGFVTFGNEIVARDFPCKTVFRITKYV